PDLVKLRGAKQCAGDQAFAGGPQVRVRSGESDLSEMKIEDRRTGIDAARQKVVIEVPPAFDVRRGRDSQPGNQRGQVPRAGKKRDGGKVCCGLEHIATSGYYGSPKRG